MKRKSLLLAAAVVLSLVVGICGASVGVYFGFRSIWPSSKSEPFRVQFDTTGPYVIAATKAADQDFVKAVASARSLHPQAAYVTFDLDRLDLVREQLKRSQPRYVLVVLKPDELDVNFAWQWLTLTTQLDEDPLVDVSSGFITGDTPEAAEAFVNRIASVARGETKMPGRLIDNLGPNSQATKTQFSQQQGSFMIPVYMQRGPLTSISHGSEGFSNERINSLRDAGLIHFGGHGYPDRIVDGMSGQQAQQLKLDPAVIFNGACYTGVTHRWFEQWTVDGTIKEAVVTAKESVCLNLLKNNVIAYLAALHPDHGIPVYQEMEYLAYSGASLGDVMRHTHNEVILGNGGRLPQLVPFADGTKTPAWTPSDVMLKGTAARILFGDPALRVCKPFTPPPLNVTVTSSGEKPNQLRVTAVVSNVKLKSEYTDTYHADLASNKQLFNDRVLIRAELPPGWKAVDKVQVESVRSGSSVLKHRLVGFALEIDNDMRRLHVQVDVPSSGYMQSKLRKKGAEVVIMATRMHSK